MTWWMWALALWFVCSVVCGLFIGKVIALGNGTSQRRSVQGPTTHCTTCNGTGWYVKFACPSCGGTGRVSLT